MAGLLAPFAGDQASELARRLLTRFGTLSVIVSAPPAQIREAAGDLADTAMQIYAARQLVETAMRDRAGQMDHGQVYPVNTAMLDYLRGKIGNNQREHIHVIFGDARLSYLADETVSDGGVSVVRTRAHSLLQRARALGASSIVLAHNHPSGNCRPSEADVLATRRLDRLAHAAGVTLLDHLILTETSAYSMKAGGQL